MDAQKYMRWKDALNYNNANLENVMSESKKVNSAYQKYLQENPHKNKKKELSQRKEKLINRILELSRQGYEGYDGK